MANFMLCVFIAHPNIRYLFMKIEGRGEKEKRKKGKEERIQGRDGGEVGEDTSVQHPA